MRFSSLDNDPGLIHWSNICLFYLLFSCLWVLNSLPSDLAWINNHLRGGGCPQVSPTHAKPGGNLGFAWIRASRTSFLLEYVPQSSASSRGIVPIVWVGAVVGRVVAGDTAVHCLHTVAKIVIGVKVRDVTICLPFFSCKQRAFDVSCVFECGFDMTEKRLLVSKMWKLLSPTFICLSHKPLVSDVAPRDSGYNLMKISCPMGNSFQLKQWHCLWALQVCHRCCRHFMKLFISCNNPWRWVAVPSNDADQITAITSYTHADGMTCARKGFALEMGAYKLFTGQNPKLYEVKQTYCFHYKWEIPLILLGT